MITISELTKSQCTRRSRVLCGASRHHTECFIALLLLIQHILSVFSSVKHKTVLHDKCCVTHTARLIPLIHPRKDRLHELKSGIADPLLKKRGEKGSCLSAVREAGN